MLSKNEQAAGAYTSSANESDTTSAAQVLLAVLVCLFDQNSVMRCDPVVGLHSLTIPPEVDRADATSPAKSASAKSSTCVESQELKATKP